VLGAAHKKTPLGFAAGRARVFLLKVRELP
jgi:hypothetical protein